jgi:RNA polymerase sigma-70 factor (ECF subfamily)
MTAMPTSGRTTDPKLLEQVRDWRDSQAWARFVSHYQPRLCAVCRVYGLVGDSADDCCQQVWIKLASAMRRFHYDPSRRFRYWLRSFFHSRIKDVVKASQGQYPEVQMTGDVAFDPFGSEHDHDDEERDPEILVMLRRAKQVQDAVQARVTPDNWEVFRLVAIEGHPIPEAAELLGREYITVYRSYKRVSQMIADERRRRDGLAGEAFMQS